MRIVQHCEPAEPTEFLVGSFVYVPSHVLFVTTWLSYRTPYTITDNTTVTDVATKEEVITHFKDMQVEMIQNIYIKAPGA